MFEQGPGRKNFSYTSRSGLAKEHGRPLREKMKFSSLSSQDTKPSRRKTVFMIVLLLAVSAFIWYYGFKSSAVREVEIPDNEIEKVNE